VVPEICLRHSHRHKDTIITILHFLIVARVKMHPIIVQQKCSLIISEAYVTAGTLVDE